MGAPKLSKNTVNELLDDISKAAKANSIATTFLEDSLIPAGDAEISPRDFIEQLDSLKKTSIAKKINSGAYEKDIFLFYKDLKLACIHELNQLAIGSDRYKETFSVFLYLSELILREGYRLGYLEVDHKNSDDEDEDKEQVRNHIKEFETAISAKFRSVEADIKSAYGEAFYVVTQNRGPLFSSINGKASIDPRETKTHGSFNTTKVQPLTQSFIAPYQLGFVSPATTNIPHPALPPTDMLGNFVPPVESPMPSTTWLKFDEYSSFAPTKDSGNALLGEALVGSVWYEKKFVPNHLDPALEKAKASSPGQEDVSMKDEDDDEEQEDEQERKEPNDKDTEQENGTKIKDEETNGNDRHGNDDSQDESSGDEDESGEDDDIDLLKVLEWAPGNEIDDEELEAFEKGEADQYLSKLILKTQFLQRARLASNDGSEFSVADKEREAALKARNLLAHLAAEFTPKELGIVPITDLPVLQVNYQGTLPGTDRPAAQSRASGVKVSNKSSKANRR